MITASQARQIIRDSLTPDLAELEVKIKEASLKGFSFIRIEDGIWHRDNRCNARAVSLISTVRELGYKIEYTGKDNQITLISW